MERIDLILHPVRFRILETLVGDALTTQAISDRLPDVPTSSIYRHLKLLLDEGVVAVEEARPVRGAVERVYRLAQPIHLGPDEVRRMSADEHVTYFSVFVMSLIRGFSAYVNGRDEPVDLLADHAGYTEAFVFATRDELERFATALNEALRPLAENKPGPGRRRHKIAIITHPEPLPDAEGPGKQG